jgi:hypothetical protein
MDIIRSLGLVDTLVVIVIIGIAGAFLYWIYEHVVRFFTISSWRDAPNAIDSSCAKPPRAIIAASKYARPHMTHTEDENHRDHVGADVCCTARGSR